MARGKISGGVKHTYIWMLSSMPYIDEYWYCVAGDDGHISGLERQARKLYKERYGER